MRAHSNSQSQIWLMPTLLSPTSVIHPMDPEKKHCSVTESGVLCVQNIHVTAYSPLGTPPSSSMFNDYQPELVMNDPVVKEMAEKYNKNVGQVRHVTPAWRAESCCRPNDQSLVFA